MNYESHLVPVYLGIGGSTARRKTENRDSHTSPRRNRSCAHRLHTLRERQRSCRRPSQVGGGPTTSVSSESHSQRQGAEPTRQDNGRLAIEKVVRVDRVFLNLCAFVTGMYNLHQFREQNNQTKGAVKC